jgi:DNA-binding transcriptional LysR family regulator
LLALRKSAPRLSIQIEEGTRSVLINALRRGEIDCVIGRLDTNDEQHFHIEMFSRFLWCLLRALNIRWRAKSTSPGMN